MKNLDQLFKALRNVEPKWDYHSEMYPSQFVDKNKQHFDDRVAACEMTDVSYADMMEVAERLLKYLPYKSGANYVDRNPVVSDSEFWNQFAHWGNKRDKKGLDK